MTQQHLNYGAFPDDPSADDFWTAAPKMEDNFTELYARSAPLFNYRSGSVYSTPRAASSNSAIVADLQYFHYFEIEEPVTIDRLAVYVTSGVVGSTALVGIYDTANGLPNNIVAQIPSAASTASNNAAAEGTLSSNVTLQRGVYWGSSLFSHAPTVSCISTSDSYHPQRVGLAIGTLGGWTGVLNTGGGSANIGFFLARSYANGLIATATGLSSLAGWTRALPLVGFKVA